MWKLLFKILGRKSVLQETKIVKVLSRNEGVYKPKEDTSEKEWEVLQQRFYFNTDTRKSIKRPTWNHCRYYKTKEGAEMALYHLRRQQWWTIQVYPNYTTLYRYKVVKRVWLEKEVTCG